MLKEQAKDLLNHCRFHLMEKVKKSEQLKKRKLKKRGGKS
jgi:hypothetical protein